MPGLPSLSQHKHSITSSESGNDHCSEGGAGSGEVGEEGVIGRCCWWWEGVGGGSWWGNRGWRREVGEDKGGWDLTSLGEGGGRDWAGLAGSSLFSPTGEGKEGGGEGELSHI